MSVSPTYWRIILRDWFNAGLTVTATLRNGAQFSGKINSRMWGSGAESDLVTLDEEQRNVTATWSGTISVRHDFDIDEIVAITAKRER